MTDWKGGICVRCGLHGLLRDRLCGWCDSGKWKPIVGMLVCTCRMRHVRITKIDDDGDTIKTDDGWSCSFTHCCDPVDHTWEHDTVTRACGAEP